MATSEWFTLQVGFTKGPHFGQVAVSIDGMAVGDDVDAYDTEIAPSRPANLGVVELRWFPPNSIHGRRPRTGTRAAAIWASIVSVCRPLMSLVVSESLQPRHSLKIFWVIGLRITHSQMAASCLSLAHALGVR